METYDGESLAPGTRLRLLQEYSDLSAQKRIAATFRDLKGQIERVQYAPQEIYESIETIDAQISELKSTIIAFIGPSGGGKSTLINCLLGGHSILPTSGGHAGTSTIIEVSYAKNQLCGVVKYISRADWRNELQTLAGDLRDAVEFPHHTDPDSDSVAMISRAKFKAVYPNINPRSISEDNIRELMSHDHLKVLGKTRKFAVVDNKNLGVRLAKIVGSSNNGSNSPQNWPLIAKVSIFLNADILKNGTILVDLPGKDDNAARTKITQDFLKKAHHTVIVSRITRATDQYIVSKLLRSTLQRRNCARTEANFTVVCTHNDDIRPEFDSEFADLTAEFARTSKLKRKRKPRSTHELYFQAISRRSANITQSFQQKVKEIEEELLHYTGNDRASQESTSVLCVSSHAFQCFKPTLRKKVLGFRNVTETGIPQLQDHLRQLVDGNALEHYQHCLANITSVFDSMDFWAKAIDRIRLTPEIQTAYRLVDQWMKALYDKLDQMIDLNKRSLQELVSNELILAKKECSDNAKSVASRWSRGGRTGVHWNTYRAICRRHGRWAGSTAYHNWPAQLLEPGDQTLNSGWKKLFHVCVWPGLNGMISETKKSCVKFEQETVAAFHLTPRTVAPISQSQQKLRIERRVDACFDETRLALGAIRPLVFFCLENHIVEYMEKPFDVCAASSGVGVLAAMSQIMEAHFDKHGRDMFNSVYNGLGLRIEKELEEFHHKTRFSLNQLATSLKCDLAQVVGCGQDDRTKSTIGNILTHAVERAERVAVSDFQEDSKCYSSEEENNSEEESDDEDTDDSSD